MNRRNQKGFSLIEALVALSLMTFAAMAMSQVITNLTKQQRLISARFERSDLEAGLRQQFASIDTCGCNLNNAQFDPATASLVNGWIVASLKTFSSDCTTSTPLVNANAALPGTQVALKIGNVRLLKGQQIDADTFAFTLQVNYQTDGIPMRASMIPNVYVRTKSVGALKQTIGCSTSPLPALIPKQAYKLTCTSLSGISKTITTVAGNSGSVLTTISPSGQGYWAVSVSNDSILEAENCFSDQTIAAGSVAQKSGVALCKANAADGKSCWAYGTCTYNAGGSNPFQSCSYSAQ